MSLVPILARSIQRRNAAVAPVATSFFTHEWYAEDATLSGANVTSWPARTGTGIWTPNNSLNWTYSATGLDSTYPALSVINTDWMEGDVNVRSIMNGIGYFLAVMVARRQTGTRADFAFSQGDSISTGRINAYHSGVNIYVDSTRLDSESPAATLIDCGVAINATTRQLIARELNYSAGTQAAAVDSTTFVARTPPTITAGLTSATDSLATRLNGILGGTFRHTTMEIGSFHICASVTPPDPADVTVSIQAILDSYGIA